MSRNIVFGALLSLALVGCGAPKQAPEAPTPVQPPPPVVVEPEPEPEPSNTVTVSGDTWELTVPSSVQRGRARNPSVVFAGLDNGEKRLFLLVRKEVKGDSAEGLKTFVDEVTSDFVESGFTPTVKDKGTINGVPFAKLEGFKPPIVMHNWMLVKSENGYLLACGGLMTQAASHAEVCSKVAASLKLK